MKITWILLIVAVGVCNGFVHDGDDNEPSSSSLTSKKRRIQLSGSDPSLNSLNHHHVNDLNSTLHSSGSGPLIDDDEDYNYIDEVLVEPSTPVIPILPTPTPTVTLEPATATSNNIIPTSSFGIGETELRTKNDWLIGSGDFETIDPTPTLAYHPSSSIIVAINNPPRLVKPINKILVHGGSLHRQRIDNNFHDDDDATLKYKLHAEVDWIHISNHSIVMLPTVEDVSEYRFNITAMDEHGGSLTTDVIVNVRQPARSRLWYYEYTFSFPTFTNWREKLYKDMTADRAPSDFVVKKVVPEGNMIKIHYVNESLILNECPIETIKNVRNHYRRIYPDFEFTLVPGMICESFRNVTSSGNVNYPPSIKNQIDLLSFSFGELSVHQVPKDFCYDPEEGGTSNLKLRAYGFDNQNQKIKSDNWIQFDDRNQEFFGIPVHGRVNTSDSSNQRTLAGGDKSTDGGVSGGRYVLYCRDSAGKEAQDVIDTIISNTHQHRNYTAEFSLHFSVTSFPLSQIRKFIEKLAHLFNSPTSDIIVKSYTIDNSIVHFTWFNKSNPGEKDLTQLRKVLFSNEGPVDKRVVEMFSPEFNISGGNVVPIGKIFGEDTIFHFGAGEPGGDVGVAGEEFDGDEGVVISTEYSGYLVTYIIPSVLIAVMVLLSGIIACLLSRKKKLPGDTEIKVGGGVPVIFQDELDSEQALLNAGNQPPPISQPAPLHSQPPPRMTPTYRESSIPRTHAPPGYKSVSKYEPPLPPVQFHGTNSASMGKFSQCNPPPPPYNTPYVPP